MARLFYLMIFFGILACSLRAETSYEDKLIAAINSERMKANLPSLEKDERLMRIASEWAQAMATRKKMVHRDTLRPYLKEYDWKTMNENISASPSTASPENIVERWMKSSGHRRNLLQDDIRWVGVGISTASDGSFYAVFNGSGSYPKAG